MKIALFGPTGMIGQRILAEAVQRGHAVTAVARDPGKVTPKAPNLRVVQGDLTDAASVQAIAAGNDVVISAFAAPHGQESQVLDVTRILIQAAAALKPQPRVIAVGGAGGLEVAPGVRVIDTPSFPAAWKAIAQTHINAYEIYRTSAINWTFFSPAGDIQPGQRTGKYRTGRDQLIVDAAGHSRISAEDYAVALIDEIEKPQFERSRMTVGY